jgi:hypothetical protein
MKFATLEEVREYLGGQRIECLICGQICKRLQFRHLEKHGLTADGYRELFGIPWTFSLTSAPSRQVSRDHVSEKFRKTLASNRFDRGPSRGRKRLPCLAVAKQWEISAELGREVSARRRVTVPCSGGCGVMLETTALTAVQPIFCDACASPGALSLRRRNAKKKAASDLAA